MGAAAIATATVVARAGATDVPIGTLAALGGFSDTLLLVMAVRMAAVFILATASLGLTTGVLPRWFDLASYVCGVVLILTPLAGNALFLAFPTWLVMLSVMLLHHIRQLSPDELPGFAARYLSSPQPAEEAD